tara:strand:- start:897 stop:1115 length:219 start_codon:yes stop_codon:yes gene_type:complete
MLDSIDCFHPAAITIGIMATEYKGHLIAAFHSRFRSDFEALTDLIAFWVCIKSVSFIVGDGLYISSGFVINA